MLKSKSRRRIASRRLLPAFLMASLMLASGAALGVHGARDAGGGTAASAAGGAVDGLPLSGPLDGLPERLDALDKRQADVRDELDDVRAQCREDAGMLQVDQRLAEDESERADARADLLALRADCIVQEDALEQDLRLLRIEERELDRSLRGPRSLDAALLLGSVRSVDDVRGLAEDLRERRADLREEADELTRDCEREQDRLRERLRDAESPDERERLRAETDESRAACREEADRLRDEQRFVERRATALERTFGDIAAVVGTDTVEGIDGADVRERIDRLTQVRREMLDVQREAVQLHADCAAQEARLEVEFRESDDQQARADLRDEAAQLRDGCREQRAEFVVEHRALRDEARALERNLDRLGRSDAGLAALGAD